MLARAGTIAVAKPTDTTNFVYTCPGLAATTYTVTATGQGGLAGFAYSIDQSNVRSTTMTAPSTWPSNAGLLGPEEGRIVLSALHQRGFTIIELLVGLTLLAVLLGLGVPAMGTYLQNSKLASAASSYFSGLQMARTEAIRRNVRTEFVMTDTPVAAPEPANALVPADGRRNWVVRAGLGRPFLPAIEAKAGAEGDGSATAAAIQVSARHLRRRSSTARSRSTASARTADGAPYQIDISNPAAGHCVAGGGRSAAGASLFRPAARSPPAIRPRRHRRETAVRAEHRRRAPSQRGFFLIEAMVAILIFALGILGLVAMGGTAVSSQSDAQYRTEASSLADAIAGELALGIDRTSEANKAASLANFAHQPNPPPTTSPAPCSFNGTVVNAATHPASPRCSSRAANATATPGLPGATAANQQVFVDAVGNFNRVVITLCWKTASDNAWRRHTLVTYVN